jgi:hypothetical protein
VRCFKSSVGYYVGYFRTALANRSAATTTYGSCIRPGAISTGPVRREDFEIDTGSSKAETVRQELSSKGGGYEQVANGGIVALELSRTEGAKGQALWVQSSSSGEPPRRSARLLKYLFPDLGNSRSTEDWVGATIPIRSSQIGYKRKSCRSLARDGANQGKIVWRRLGFLPVVSLA